MLQLVHWVCDERANESLPLHELGDLGGRVGRGLGLGDALNEVDGLEPSALDAVVLLDGEPLARVGVLGDPGVLGVGDDGVRRLRRHAPVPHLAPRVVQPDEQRRPRSRVDEAHAELEVGLAGPGHALLQPVSGLTAGATFAATAVGSSLLALTLRSRNVSFLLPAFLVSARHSVGQGHHVEGWEGLLSLTSGCCDLFTHCHTLHQDPYER